jgi:hypothetical protein
VPSQDAAATRECLIPDEVLDRPDLDVDTVSRWLRNPVDELRDALSERAEGRLERARGRYSRGVFE